MSYLPFLPSQCSAFWLLCSRGLYFPLNSQEQWMHFSFLQPTSLKYLKWLVSPSLKLFPVSASLMVPFSSLALLCLSGECSVLIPSCLFSVLPLKVCDPYGSVPNLVFFLLYTLAWERGRVPILFISVQTLFLNCKLGQPVGLCSLSTI